MPRTSKSGITTNDMLVKVYVEAANMTAPTVFVEVIFADGATINEDKCIQQLYDCTGVRLVPTQPMVPLGTYHLVPSVAFTPTPSSTRKKSVPCCRLKKHCVEPQSFAQTQVT